MPNDPFLDLLVTDLKPVRRRTMAGDALVLTMLCTFEFGLFLSLGAMRSDVIMAMHLPSFWWKLASLGLIALVGMVFALISLDPARSPRRGLRWLVVIFALCVAVGWVLDATRAGLPAFEARLNWHAGLGCVYKMVLLSIPPMIGLGMLTHRGAPTDPGGTALAAGAAAAAWGAFTFVFACPQDDPLYIAIWYSVGCGIVTMFARLVVPLLTYW